MASASLPVREMEGKLEDFGCFPRTNGVACTERRNVADFWRTSVLNTLIYDRNVCIVRGRIVEPGLSG